MFWNAEVEENMMVKIPKECADFLGMNEGDKLVISSIGTESLNIKKAKPQEVNRREFLKAMSKGFIPQN